MIGYIISERGISEFDISSLRNSLLEFMAKQGIFSVTNFTIRVPKGTTMGTQSGVIIPKLASEDITLKSAILVGPSKVEEYKQDFEKTTNS